MPKKKRGKRKPRHIKVTHQHRPSSGDLVAIQIAVKTSKKINKKLLSRELVESLIRHKAETSDGTWTRSGVVGAVEGQDPAGMHLVIIRWKNPERDDPSDAGWRYASDTPSDQADAWGTLRRIILGAQLSTRFDR